MKGLVKGIIIGVVIIVIGVCILIAGLALNGWKFGNDPNFTVDTFVAEADNTAIDVKVGAGTVTAKFYDGDKIEIDYPVSSVYRTDFSESGGTLSYSARTKRFIFWGITDIPETVIRLPKDKIFDVKLELDAGSLSLAEGVYGDVYLDMDAGTFSSDGLECVKFGVNMDAGTCNIGTVNCDGKVTLDIDAGTLKIGSVSCSSLDFDMSAGSAKLGGLTSADTVIDISAGSADLKFTDKREEFNITTRISAGSCNVNPQSGTTDKTISVKVSAGSASLSFGG